MQTSDKLVDERHRALARVVHDLHAALGAVQHAHAENRAHELGLELPAERIFLDAINACAKAREKEQT